MSIAHLRSIATVCLVLGTQAFAQSGEWVRNVKGEILITPELTFGQAREAAIREAQAEAIRIIAGVSLQAETAGWQGEKMEGEEQKTFEMFSAATKSTTTGRVLDFRIIRDTIHQISLPDMPVQKTYFVLLDVEVITEELESDPAFSLTATLNRSTYRAGKRPQDGDEVVVFLEPTQDCYITLFSLSRDTVRVLLPNQFIRANFFPGKTISEFPSREMRRRGFHLQVGLYESEQAVTEMIEAIATKHPVEFKTEKSEGGFNTLPTYVAAYSELTRWLVNINPKYRASASVSYRITR